MTTVVIFGSSLFVAILLVLLQAWELRRAKKNIILSLLAKLDPLSEKLIEVLKFRLLQAIQTLRFVVLVWSKEFASNLSSKAIDRLIKEFETRKGTVMGKKEIRNNGAVSFYLRKIQEDKSNGEKGKIEEESL